MSRVGLAMLAALALLGISSRALGGPAVAKERGLAGRGAAWPERVIVRERVPAEQVVFGTFLFTMISRTTSPERGPYRLTRTDLHTGAVTRGPLFALPRIAAASGRLWITGASRGRAEAVELDPATLRAVRTIVVGRSFGDSPFIGVAPGRSGSVWLGSNQTLVRVAARSGRVLARASVPGRDVVADAATDPSRRFLYVSFATKVRGGVAYAALSEYDAVSGRELAQATSKLLGYSVGGATLTAVRGGVWASFRTGMLGLTIHFRQRDLSLLTPPGAKAALGRADTLFHWPMSATTLFGGRSLWLTNEAGVLACLDPGTARVRAREHLPPSRTLDLLAVDPTRHRLFALNNAITLVEITPPASCW